MPVSMESLSYYFQGVFYIRYARKIGADMVFDPQQQAFLYTLVKHKCKKLLQASAEHYEWAQKFKSHLTGPLIGAIVEFIDIEHGISRPGTAIRAHWDSVRQPIEDPTTLARPPRNIIESPWTHSQKGPEHASPEVTSLKYDPTKVAAPTQAAAQSMEFPEREHNDFLDGPRHAPPPGHQDAAADWYPESSQPAASSGGQRRPARDPYQDARRSDSPQAEKSPASRERNYRRRSPRPEIQRSPPPDPPFPIMPDIPDDLSEDDLSEDEKLRRRGVANRVHSVWEEAWRGNTLNILLEGESRREDMTERVVDDGRLASAQRRIDQIYKEDQKERQKYEDKRKKEREQLESGDQTQRHVQERNEPSGRGQLSREGEQRRPTERERKERSERERLTQKPAQEQKRSGGGRRRH